MLCSSNLQNFSSLHFAAYHGDAKLVRQLLERNDVDLDHQDKSGLTAAMIAAQKAHIEVFKELIFARANVSMKSTKGATTMNLAEENGYKELCKRVMCDAITAGVLQGADFKEIHFATRENCELLLHLLKHGHSFNSLDNQGSTPLMTCVREGHIDACKLLLNEGADCYISNRVGETALSLTHASKKMVEEIILDHVAKKVVLTVAHLSKHTKQGKGSPHLKSVKLLKSAEKGHIKVFKELIFAGANITMKSTKGATTMNLAEENGYKELCDKRVMFDAITAGVLQGAHFKEIHFAARGNCELLLHLLKHGHSVNSLDNQGSTPLMTCVREGHSDACKLLLNEGADCYISNRVGETTLSLTHASKKMVEEIILDHIAKKVVLTVAQLSKHTKQGKGSPHLKSVKLLKSSVLSWGSSKKRNVYCMENLNASRMVIRLADECSVGPRCNFTQFKTLKTQRGPSEHSSASRLVMRFALEFFDKSYGLSASSNTRRMVIRLIDGCSEDPRCNFRHSKAMKTQRGPFEHPSASRMISEIVLELSGKSYGLPASSNASRMVMRLADGCSKRLRCNFTQSEALKTQRGPSEYISTSRLVMRLALELANKSYDLPASSNASHITIRLADECLEGPRCDFT
ncbi:hypothetical protein L7F22_010262 [Adiantum nelumboides]|nr:hypothetical protein [Adiantum nelumboides]